MSSKVDISHIVTVYNKEKYLPDTVASLLAQEGGFSREFIFVDDVSTDGSLRVIEEATQKMSNVTVIRNSDNRGPSVRLNQAAKLARGEYLHFLDSDDMVPVNGIQVLYDTIQKTSADFVYGQWLFTHKPGNELRDWKIKTIPEPKLYTDPLQAVLEGRNRRMCTLVKRELFEKSGGADEAVFIQDESLPLRLAMHAKRFARIEVPVNLIPETQENLSGNKTQLNYDRFFAYYNALIQHPALDARYRRQMFTKCLSAYWKEYRAEQGIGAHLSPVFLRYAKDQLLPAGCDMEYLKQAADYFCSRPSVRRASAS